MNSRLMRAAAIVGTAVGLALVAAACSAGAPTPTYIQLTPTPVPPTPIIIYVTPAPTATPTATPAVASSTPAKSAAATAAASPTAIPTPGPGGPAGGCSGASKPDNEAFWAVTANNVPFTVYCGAVPKPWYFVTASSTYGKTGTVTATYQNLSGAQIVIQEGAFCTSGSSACSPHDTVVGSAKFGGLAGSLDTLSGGGFAIYVNPGTTAGYTATGTNVTQATFVSIVAALIKVPKS